AARFLSNNGAGAVESFKARHRIQPGWLHILHVGSNDPRKNLGTVFRVVAALKQKHKKDVCLVKVGAAFGPRETQAIQTMGLQEAVRHLGELSDEEIAHVYRACDVLLYPSFHEGMGRPVAEAMASGTPVVASNRGAIPEVVQHPNSLFDPVDAYPARRRKSGAAVWRPVGGVSGAVPGTGATGARSRHLHHQRGRRQAAGRSPRPAYLRKRRRDPLLPGLDPASRVQAVPAAV